MLGRQRTIPAKLADLTEERRRVEAHLHDCIDIEHAADCALHAAVDAGDETAATVAFGRRAAAQLDEELTRDCLDSIGRAINHLLDRIDIPGRQRPPCD